MRDEVRRMALFGSGVAELTRHRAEQIARDLVERSKQNRDELMRLIRAEIQNQIRSLGVATKRDLERIERRVARSEDRLKELAQKKPAPPASREKKPASKTSATAKKKTS